MTRTICLAVVAAACAVGAAAQSGPTNTVTLTGCLQRGERNAPTPYVLLSASDSGRGGSPSGSTTPPQPAPDTPTGSTGASSGSAQSAGSAGASGSSAATRPSPPEARSEPSGSSRIDAGVTYGLEGSADFAASAGKRVAVTGTLVAGSTRNDVNGASTDGKARGKAQRIRVASLRVLGDCARR